ncbi:hypothetical protein JOD45_000347 [Scopulibacillus daqui]|uniref:Uncharacterized protein n=1 Tax=Scopulibacillus daqui TaxID=1469162 RepID=A0ABS2PW48_9BACL|nr:hypothetical protein [Scopulibacillus daqui]MBM7644156.1 hypothetical protein [Scopulibacillus daqui]
MHESYFGIAGSIKLFNSGEGVGRQVEIKVYGKNALKEGGIQWL